VKPLAPAVSDIETYGAMLGTAFIEKTAYPWRFFVL
jgi:hypothetical protein